MSHNAPGRYNVTRDLSSLPTIAQVHPSYRDRLEQWIRCIDVAGGTDEVKARGPVYLPQLSADQDPDDYAAYIARAPFYPAMSRTVELLTGAVFRHPVTLTGVEPLGGRLNDIDMMGSSLSDLAQDVVTELLTTGRCAVALEAIDSRVVWAMYPAVDVLSWLHDRGRLVRVVLRSMQDTTDEADEWRILTTTTYRVLDYADDAPRERIYDAQGDLVSESPVGRTDGSVLDVPPVLIFSSGRRQRVPCKPPLLDLADVNLSHYRLAADQEHAAHWTASPTPWVAGKGDMPDDLVIGSQTAWRLDAGTEVGMLEFTGAGMAAMSVLLKERLQEMAALGARLIGEPMRPAQTAEATRIEASGDTATLSTMVSAVDQGFTRLLRWQAEWEGLDVGPDLSVELNRDYIDSRLPAADVTALIELRQANLISPETVYDALLRGEWANRRRTFEDERLLIEAARSPSNPAPGPSPGSQPPEED